MSSAAAFGGDGGVGGIPVIRDLFLGVEGFSALVLMLSAGRLRVTALDILEAMLFFGGSKSGDCPNDEPGSYVAGANISQCLRSVFLNAFMHILVKWMNTVAGSAFPICLKISVEVPLNLWWRGKP